MKTKLTESTLRKFIRESIRKRLNEMEWTTAKSAADKAFVKSLDSDDNPKEKTRRERQHKNLSKYSRELLDKKHGVDKIKAKHKENKHYLPSPDELNSLKNELDDYCDYENGRLDEIIKKVIRKNLLNP